MRTARSFLLVLAFALAAAAQPTQQRDPLPVPDVPGYKTLKCDFHIHTVFSDGEVWPTTRLIEAFRDGLDAIALTDHAAYNPHKEDVKPDNARPHEIARLTAEGMGIILVPGIEVNDGNIHYNALFVTDPNALRGLPLKDALQKAKEQGAFAFWNHPGWKGKAQWVPPMSEFHDAQLFQGMELLNGASFYSEAYPWFAERKLAILANSDVHRLIADSYEKRGRPVTLVFAKTRDLAGVKEALVARRSAAWMNDEVWGLEEQLAPLCTAAVRLEPNEVSWRPGIPGVPLILRNTSALPFKVRLKSLPEWLKGPTTTVSVKPEGATGIALAVAKDAPAGRHQLEVEVEIANFHTGPGQNLITKLPLTVTVSR